jgi:hypothetical protein
VQEKWVDTFAIIHQEYRSFLASTAQSASACATRAIRLREQPTHSETVRRHHPDRLSRNDCATPAHGPLPWVPASYSMAGFCPYQITNPFALVAR